MIYVWTGRSSVGARDLAAALNAINPGSARRVRRDKHQVSVLKLLKPDDLVVAWGDRLVINACKVLNGRTVVGKLNELNTLKEAGVNVPPFSTQKKEGWLARASNHVGAADLLSGRTIGDYYTEFIECDREYRVHSFGGRSIRLAKKVPNSDGLPVNPRFRAYDAGWRFSYAKHEDVPRGLREEAHKAVKALGLQFGAVDVGVTKVGGKPLVFEVNSAPGLEGGSAPIYAKAIVGFLNGDSSTPAGA